MAIPEISSLSPLLGPYEILELGDGGVKELIVTRWQLGRMTIHPRPMGAPKGIVALRVYVPERIKPLYPDYYDIAAQTLIAQLQPILEAGGYERKVITITKHGTGSQARFSVKVTPL